MLKHWREAALALVLLGPLLVLLAVPAIPQDPGYHDFVDTRPLAGIPNFQNIASNFAFLIVGAIGVVQCLRNKPDIAPTSWTLFFLGTAVVAFGSSYYHWAPSNGPLVWDRLPMTVAFMALFVALLSEQVTPRVERVGLPIAIAVGAASVAWWSYTDDLRLYGWVQFAPLVAVALMLALFRGRYGHRGYLACALAFYILAKLAEAGDAWVYALTRHVTSGHALKHVLAALAPYSLLLMLRARAAAPAFEPSETRSRRSP